MATINEQALAEHIKSILHEDIVETIVFNGMVQTEDYNGIIYLDVKLADYCKNAKYILNIAKTQLELEEPEYEYIDNMLDQLEEASPGVAAKKVYMSVRPVRLCLTGDPEDLDVAKSALGTLERDFRMFESHIRKFIELKKQVHIFDKAAPEMSQPESSQQGKAKGKKHE